MKERGSIKISFFLAAALVCCALLPGLRARALLAGDVNGDGAVTAADARLTLRAAVFLDKLEYGTAAFAAADLDEDMLITSADARGILRIAAGLDPNRDAAYSGSTAEQSTSGGSADGSAAYRPGKYVNTTDSSLNLRADASTASRVLGSIAMLETVTVTEVRENAGAAAETRWWGKVTKNGVTGWCVLYYMTPWTLRDHTFTSAETTALWRSLAGEWEAAETEQYFRFSVQGGQNRAVFGGENGVYFSAALSGSVKGDPKGIVTVPLTVASGGAAVTLILDVSEVANGRLVWNFSYGSFSAEWREAAFAGTV